MVTETKGHIKHAQLTKPALGIFGRNELAILGTSCGNIQRLAQTIIEGLPGYKFGFTDASHHDNEDSAPSIASVSTIQKSNTTQVDFLGTFNYIHQRTLFNDATFVLVNGNHFTATRQVVVIDDAKPLHKKIDRLTNVCLVLLQEGITTIPGFLAEQVPGIKNVPVFSIADNQSIIRFIDSLIKYATPVLNGLVLAGGESKRMGSDKGSLIYHPKLTQRQYIHSLLKEHCNGDVFVSCNASQEDAVTAEGLPFITDSFTGLGPIGGILSAFRHNPNAAWLTVACDMPHLSGGLIHNLTENRNIAKMATAFRNNENNGWPEPLLTIWEPQSYQWLLQLLAQGYSCPRKALINAGIALLEIEDAAVLHNVNDYSDYLTTLNNLENA